MSTFWHKMSDLKPVCSIKMWKLTEKSYFCALSVTFLRLECILKLEDLLQGYVKWKNTMTFNVNFLTQNVGLWTFYKQCIWGYWPKNHIFVPSPLHFWGWVHFKVGRSPSRTMLSGKTQWRLMSTFWHKMSGRGLFISNVYGDIDRKIIFLCPLRYIFEARCAF